MSATISFQVGSHEDMAKAIHAATENAGSRGIEVFMGELRIGAHSSMPIAAICADVSQQLHNRSQGT